MYPLTDGTHAASANGSVYGNARQEFLQLSIVVCVCVCVFNDQYFMY